MNPPIYVKPSKRDFFAKTDTVPHRSVYLPVLPADTPADCFPPDTSHRYPLRSHHIP